MGKGLAQAHQGSYRQSSRLGIHYTTLSPSPQLGSPPSSLNSHSHPRQLVSSHTSLVPVSEHPSLSGRQALTETTASLLMTPQAPGERSSQERLGQESQEAMGRRVDSGREVPSETLWEGASY